MKQDEDGVIPPDLEKIINDIYQEELREKAAGRTIAVRYSRVISAINDYKVRENALLGGFLERMKKQMKIETEYGVYQLVGKAHNACEDRYRILGSTVPLAMKSQRGFLFAVMDGVGDAPRGMDAADHLALRLTDFYRSPYQFLPDLTGLKTLLREINMEIHGWGMMGSSSNRPLGASAFTVLWIAPDLKVVTLTAGDTCAWRLRAGTLTKLTSVSASGAGGTISNYAGVGSDFKFDECVSDLNNGDRYLLFTDGVIKGLTTSMTESKLRESPDPEATARQIVELARAKGSADDITALVVDAYVISGTRSDQ